MSDNTTHLIIIGFVLAFLLLIFLLNLPLAKYKRNTPRSKPVKSTRTTRKGRKETRVLFEDGHVAIYKGSLPFSANYLALQPVKVFRPSKPVKLHVPYE